MDPLIAQLVEAAKALEDDLRQPNVEAKYPAIVAFRAALAAVENDAREPQGRDFS